MQAKDKTRLTYEEASRFLTYDKDSGNIQWICNKGVRKTGDAAGRIGRDGYLWTTFNGHRFANHRLAWLLTYGRFPEEHLDHINQDKTDNRIQNLRECTHAENCQNREIYQTNKWGFAGIAIARNKYKAVIQVGSVKKSIGVWDTPEQAHAVYLAVKEALHPFSKQNGGSSLKRSAGGSA